MLRLEGVSVGIGAVRVLRSVTLEVGSGMRVALIGRNGAGKTTTLRAVMGLLQAEGKVLLDGAEINGLPGHRRTRLGVGYAPEERRLFGTFSVEQNLLLPAQVLRLPVSEIRSRLDKVYAILPELTELRERRAGALSGGQGKMVALGRALMVGTRLVLLDEPFQGLAPVLARRYAEALKRLREAEPNLSILITESNPDLLRPMVEATYLIERGEVQSGTLAGSGG
jgi:ABC-type branched-subunit amino acid transport system ATPase component